VLFLPLGCLQDAPDVADLSLAKALKIEDNVVFNYLTDNYDLHKVRCSRAFSATVQLWLSRHVTEWLAG
jgi:hypothetical protein